MVGSGMVAGIAQSMQGGGGGRGGRKERGEKRRWAQQHAEEARDVRTGETRGGERRQRSSLAERLREEGEKERGQAG
ncbi:hypothetical protein L227DRAFT_122916 [Lentinus tigrinus ALCF2SS1-6]|uniref:Uncharacterized protein n=1 Tax=Lentinus tigrinus ALCF2SS1-6 TaxID=1328759 RepID=A0A5C2SYJ4_9APHY|nr:hypothetical protein L227DRAFT_122916 [Lentinus tigrinus ALCF2SS1-6]